MRAIGLKAALLAICLAPAAPAQVRDVLGALSMALEDRNPDRFLVHIDKARCREYPALERNVVALLAQYEIGSSIAVVEEKEDDGAYDVKVDWLLHLKPAGGEAPVRQRRQEIRCRIERAGKQWKVTALEPASFFSILGP